MNRRNFFKVVAGAGLIPFLPKKATSNVPKYPYGDKNLTATEVESWWNSKRRALYKGYYLLTKDNRIRWTKIFSSPEEAWRECDYVDLPDAGLGFSHIEDLWICRDNLYCIGRYNIWRITYTANPDMPFEVACVGERGRNGKAKMSM